MRSRAVGSVLARTLRGLRLEGRSAQGLQLAHRHLARQRSLVFLVSDFHLPLAEIERLLASFAQHELVPVVLWDPLEFELTPARGLAQVRRRRDRVGAGWCGGDPRCARTGAAHLASAARRCCTSFARGGCSRCSSKAAFDAEAVTRHFHT